MKLWSPRFSDGTHIRMWDDDDCGIVYDALSGDTHLLQPLALELMHCLLAAPSDAAGLARAVGGLLTDDAQAEMLAMIEASLARLQDIGLAACEN